MIEIMPLYVFEQASLERFATTFVTTTRSSSAWTTSSYGDGTLREDLNIKGVAPAWALTHHGLYYG
jgi:hypothetical protein